MKVLRVLAAEVRRLEVWRSYLSGLRVDEDAVIKDVWIGQLEEERESEVMFKLGIKVSNINYDKPQE